MACWSGRVRNITWLSLDGFVRRRENERRINYYVFTACSLLKLSDKTDTQGWLLTNNMYLETTEKYQHPALSYSPMFTINLSNKMINCISSVGRWSPIRFGLGSDLDGEVPYTWQIFYFSFSLTESIDYQHNNNWDWTGKSGWKTPAENWVAGRLIYLLWR